MSFNCDNRLAVNAQLRVSGQPVGNSVNLGKCSILVDSLDHHLIATAAECLPTTFTGDRQNDSVAGSLSKNPLVIIGTPQSRYIKDLAARKMIDISEISNSPSDTLSRLSNRPLRAATKRW